MCSGRVVAGLSLATAAVLLLSSLQQESPLKPTPLDLRRPLPVPLNQHQLHSNVQALHKQAQVSENEVQGADNEVPVVYNEVQAGEITAAAVASDTDKAISKANDVPQNEGNVDERDEREKAAVPNETKPSEAQVQSVASSSSAVHSDVITNATRPRAAASVSVPAPKNDTSVGVVHTRSVYAGGHVWANVHVCRSLGRGVRVLVLVTSAPAHATLRHGARLTWANAHSRRDLALAFYIGLPADNLMEALREEQELYGDIIMGNFVDSYKNLTLKTISMLEWTFTYCPHVPRLLKTDDDMFINIPRLLQFLDARVNDTRTIWGRVVHRWLPNRSPNSKYYLSKKQFPGKMLPTFATGPAYVLTQDAVRPLWEATLTRDAIFLSLEDVAVTGVAAQRAKIRLVNAGEFVNRHIRPSACALKKLISVHMVSVETQLDLWRTLHAGKCKT